MPQLTHVAHADDRQVVGLTSVDSRRLFVLHYPSEQQIEVYDTRTFKLEQTLKVVGLSDDSPFNGLTSCVINNCLYVSDNANATVYKIELTNHNEVSKWQVDDRDPSGLSVNAARNLLVTCQFDDSKLLEYTPSGSLIREIRLQVTSEPHHAIQLTSDQFVVCTSNDIIAVNSQGRVVISYTNQLQSTTRHQFKWPHHLAVHKNYDRIFVADEGNDRIVVLSRSLKCAHEFNASVDGSKLQPRCLYLNQSNTPLYVGSGDGRIFVFDIRRH
jgi:DNA-binding beta-propeller fold protein YncE